MKSFILATAAGAALLGLSACDSGADDAATTGGDTTIIEGATPMPTATVTETTTADSGNTVTLDKNGVTADINSGSATVQMKTGDKPSATVKTN